MDNYNYIIECYILLYNRYYNYIIEYIILLYILLYNRIISIFLIYYESSLTAVATYFHLQKSGLGGKGR